MAIHRPLFKHIRDHDALFSELAMIRNDFASTLGLMHHDYHKTPKFVTPEGQRLTIEPERSIVVPSFKNLRGVKRLLEQHIPGFNIVAKSDIGFRYPTAAIAGLDAPFIKRFRSEFFHKEGENRNICRPINLSYGIKSRGKGDARQEYEVWVPNENLQQDPSPLFIDKYGEDLPDDVRDFAALEPVVYGWMGVKRSAFEAIYINKSVMGDIAIIVGLSVDAYNIGARPDLSYSPRVGSSIAVGNAELEWEVMGYYAPKGVHHSHDDIWLAINHTIDVISQPLTELYQAIILPINESKTERILSTVSQLDIPLEELLEWNLKPWEFLQTSSLHRRKAHDPSRSVNLLGRLNRLFYQESHILPSLNEIHDLIAQ
ncbi:MAG: hypothetical protein NWQ54_12040 [Paraglaciecola sp.]|uniref:hypothetical protein n=1 Tax=Paraglaciecola sp. TaxID=1920173 RepID=UPI00273DF9ED|nr:hypothetical protein [Paraglaciecola sp.]MDP5031068.1 hypothetical protein [Paraglaciecola sp.]MDP5041144.1 hypothetical protein [Paraglaciecola sp.]MDP5131609.1 hypothetical protein [Paraglaciecola sp.]